MNTLKAKIKSRQGFTIVELLVVITIIGILATISIISYGAWRHSAISAKVKSDLNGVSAAMESARTFNNVYPSTVPSSIVASSGVTLSGGSADGTTYCVEADSTEDITVQYYVASETRDQGALAGTCATRTTIPAPGVPPNLAVVSAALTTINLSWSAAANAVTYTTQCASDAGFIVGIQSVSVTAPTVTATISGLSSGGTYYCRVNAVNANSTSAWSNTINTTTSSPISLTFNNTATGKSGTIQTWTVPSTGIYTIEAWGAQGGNAYLLSTTTVNPGGSGARAKGDFSLTAGQVVNILVGQKGIDYLGADKAGGGGGGTFVVSAGALLIAAGGGGGAGQYASTSAIGGQSGTSGAAGTVGTFGAGGINGNGGGASSYGGGGAGWLTNGTNTAYGMGGASYNNGGLGGLGYGTTPTLDGGFGGGGGSYAGAGGGGGYSGGGGGGWSYSGNGGGGGSYNSGTNQSNSSGVRTGQGLVTIHN